MNHRIARIFLLALFFAGASFAAPKMGTMTDSRDGKKYKTVKIGEQVWMAENLNYETLLSYCYGDTYGRDEAECVKYGRLYKWKYAIIACPAGWHLPSVAEFETLFDAVGGKSVAGVHNSVRNLSSMTDGVPIAGEQTPLGSLHTLSASGATMRFTLTWVNAHSFGVLRSPIATVHAAFKCATIIITSSTMRN